MTAALLVSDQAGAVRLTVHSRKALVGLRTVRKITVEPANPTISWPVFSLEARLMAQVREGPLDAVRAVAALMRVNSGDASDQTVTEVLDSLEARGLLWTDPDQRDHQMLDERDHLVHGTAELGTVAAFQRLLADCRHR